jgi:predicted lipoprotein with Yx(FWY)xxD motif
MEARIGRGSVREAAPTPGRTRAALMLCAAALAVGTLALGALASSPPASAISSARTLTIRTVTIPRIGTVLATDSGHTLYHYSGDPAGKVTCTAVCAKLWPPLLLPKGVTHLKAAHGVKGFSVARVQGGRLEVFFHHEALYTFVSDAKKGQARGQGVENEWFAVLSNGKSSSKSVTATSPAAAGATTTMPPTSTPSSINATSPATQAPTTQPTQPTQPTTITTTAPPGGGFGF